MNMVVQGTTDRSSIRINARGGDNVFRLHHADVEGSLNALLAAKVDISGDVSISGSVKRLTLNDLNGEQTISIGPPGSHRDTLTLKLGQVVDTMLISQTPIRSATLINWRNTATPGNLIRAPWVGTLKATGDKRRGILGELIVNLELLDNLVAKTLGTVRVADALSGIWQIAGHVGQISVGAIRDDWSAVISGDLTGLKVSRDAAGHIEARSIGTVDVKQSYADARITLTMPFDANDPKAKALKKLNVGDTIRAFELRAKSNVGTVRARRMLDATLFTGVSDTVTDLPTSDQHFDTLAHIAAVKVKGNTRLPPWINNVRIAASRLGKIAVGFAGPNDGVGYGFAARRYDGLDYLNGAGRRKVPSLLLTSPGTTDIDQDLFFHVI